MVRIIINGYLGRLGNAVREMGTNDTECQIVAGVDTGTPKRGDRPTFPTFKNINDCDMPADVIIDCTVAEAVPGVLNYAEKKGIGIVLCTTGLSEETLEKVKNVSEKVPVFLSANMSVGINLIAEISKKMAEVLSPLGFDIEITERHHNKKLDAPSGTAFLLGDSIKEALSEGYEYVFDRSQRRSERGTKEIGMSSVRAGKITGEHSVIFAGEDEVMEISHSAYSKSVFATGAVKAAKYLADKHAGMYSMKDMLGFVMGD